MQRGEATLPTAAPSQTCPSCCASLPTGIPQQPWLSCRQRPVRLCLVPAVPGGRCLFPPGTFHCFRARRVGFVGYRVGAV